MFRFFRSQVGASMIQVMFGGAAVLGAGALVVKNIGSQSKISQYASNRVKGHQLSVEISEALTNTGACLNTLKQNADLTADMAAIYNSANTPMYVIGTQLQGGTISRIRLVNYASSPGIRATAAALRLTVQFLEKRVNGNGSYGAQFKEYDIPMYLITDDGVIQRCMSDETGKVPEALMITCEGFGGSYNPVTGGCDKLTGTTGVFNTFLEEKFCNTGPGCPHPYAGQVCTGYDTRGVDHGNWVVSGFDGGGNFTCTCMPRACPDPALYCLGTDLNTDWCYLECPQGILDPPDFSPDPSGVCAGETFTQTNSCGKTQTATGSMDCTPEVVPETTGGTVGGELEGGPGGETMEAF